MPRLLTVDFYWACLTWPIRTAFSAWQQGRIRNLLLGLPALAAIFAIAWFSTSSRLQARGISAQYWLKAQKAIVDKQYSQAQLLLNRILLENTAHIQDARHGLAVIFEESGQEDRAAALFRMLAPEDQQGYPDAHRRLAILTSSKINSQTPPEELKSFLWHLKAAKEDKSAGMSLAWGRYSLAVRDYQSAKKYFRKAVEQFPEFLVTLAEIETVAGSTDSAVSTYNQAADYLGDTIRRSPSNNLTRIDYATVLVRLGRLDDAKVILEEGMRLSPEDAKTWKFLLANLYVNFHDLMSQEGKSVSELLRQLDQALSLDGNHGPALTRLMAYAEAEVTGNVELRSILARVIAEGKQPALAHLAMGNLCWLEERRDVAMFHFEQAMAIRDDVPVMLNNLAWLISHDETKPDVDRAMGLINAALEKQPDNPSFLDTRGNILVMKKEWRAALTDLEKALKGVKAKKPVHKQLALVYTELGMQEMANIHREMSIEVLDTKSN
ncbi:MAG: tetratricopeptide repeat protein [Fuerstiella sp.]